MSLPADRAQVHARILKPPASKDLPESLARQANDANDERPSSGESCFDAPNFCYFSGSRGKARPRPALLAQVNAIKSRREGGQTQSKRELPVAPVCDMFFVPKDFRFCGKRPLMLHPVG